MSHPKAAASPIPGPRPQAATGHPDLCAPSQVGAGATNPVDPYAAYTEMAEQFDYAVPPLDEVLPPLVAGLLRVAGRQLALLAYRDAFVLGDRPLNRRSAKHKATVFAQLPPECDGQDRQWRLAWARCLDDLAADLEAGRAPLPRCTGEQWALRVMADHAAYPLACADDELADLGVPVPGDSGAYRPPYFDGVAEEFFVDGAAYSIPEACARDEADDADADDTADEAWTTPPFWFSPYGITVARPVDRGYPRWVRERIGGAATDPAGGFTRAETLMGHTGRGDAWAAYTDDYRDIAEYPTLAQVLTPQAARLLHVAALHLAEAGYEEVLEQGDEPLARDPDEDSWYPDEGLLTRLPPICDGCDQAWRLSMVRAVENLADDLAAGRAPLPRCNAEEIALHLILRDAEELLDLSDDTDLADYGLPPQAAWTPRHRQFTLMREVFFQDFTDRARGVRVTRLGGCRVHPVSVYRSPRFSASRTESVGRARGAECDGPRGPAGTADEAGRGRVVVHHRLARRVGGRRVRQLPAHV